MSFKMFFIHPRSDDYYNSLTRPKLDYIFGFTFIFMIIMSGIRGMFVQAISKAYVIYSLPGSSYYLHFQLNMSYLIISALLQIVFFALLGIFFRFIYSNKELKNELNKVDYIILMQFSICIDLLYLFFVFIQIDIGNQYHEPWAWFNDAKIIYSFLYLIFITLIIFYLVPKIMAKFDVQSSHFNKGLLFSLFISFVIVFTDVLVITGLNLVIANIVK